MIKRAQLLVCAGFATVAACSQQPLRDVSASTFHGHQCFLAGDVHGYSIAPDKSFVDVRSGGNGWFRLSLGPGCPGPEWLMKVGLRPAGVATSWICEGSEPVLIAPQSYLTQECPIIAVRQVSPGEANAGVGK